MNNELQSYARRYLKTGLSKLPEDWKRTFVRMYGSSPEQDPEAVVDIMPYEKLDWAMEQVRRSLDKLGLDSREGE